jgi:Fuc2NAc and GlcNAc transferase
VLVVLVAMSGGDSALTFTLSILAATSLGFFMLNRPPASVFLGDAGSMFLGYCFGALVLATVATGLLSFWTWLALLGYYVADTTTTTLCRIVLVRRWYGAHRSHAYQNLARIHGSHAPVTYGVALYQLLWSGPLAVASMLNLRFAPVAAGLAVLPAVAWAMRYGPLLSRD